MMPLHSIRSAFLALAFLAAAPALAQTVRVAPFDSIELEGGGHVVVHYGRAQQVRIVSGSAAFTRFVTDGSRKLRIEACNRECPRHYDLQVEITTPRIEGLGVSGGGAIDSTGGFPPPRRLALGVEGGGMVDARALGAQNVDAGVDGGGVIRLRASGRLTAAVNGGGLIRYWGNPKVTQAISGGGTVERGE
ncbi:MAG: GIN domain-containing protein [Rhizomicrobium sp.]